MIRLFTVSGVLAALLVCVLATDVSAQKGGKGDKGKDFLVKMFKTMDADDNQIITVAEYKTAMTAQMKKFAEKAGKKLSEEQLETIMQKRLEGFQKAVGQSEGLNQEQFAEFMKAQFKGKGGPKGGKKKQKDV